jgi:GT2 family glycosyltransferase
MIEIIVPNYGHECYLPDLIESIKRQDFQGWCLRIYNDDPKADLEYPFCDPAIQFIHSQVNLGQSKRFNQGIADAKSEWIGFMGADDMAMTWKVSSILDHTKETDVIYTDAVQLMPDGRRLYIKSMDFDVEVIKHKNYIVASSTAIRREFLIDNAITFDDTIHYGEDWLLYNELAKAGARFKYLPWPTVYYRDWTSNIEVRYGSDWQIKKEELRERIKNIWKI